MYGHRNPLKLMASSEKLHKWHDLFITPRQKLQKSNTAKLWCNFYSRSFWSFYGCWPGKPLQWKFATITCILCPWLSPQWLSWTSIQSVIWTEIDYWIIQRTTNHSANELQNLSNFSYWNLIYLSIHAWLKMNTKCKSDAWLMRRLIKIYETARGFEVLRKVRFEVIKSIFHHKHYGRFRTYACALKVYELHESILIARCALITFFPTLRGYLS